MPDLERLDVCRLHWRLVLRRPRSLLVTSKRGKEQSLLCTRPSSDYFRFFFFFLSLYPSQTRLLARGSASLPLSRYQTSGASREPRSFLCDCVPSWHSTSLLYDRFFFFLFLKKKEKRSRRSSAAPCGTTQWKRTDTMGLATCGSGGFACLCAYTLYETTASLYGVQETSPGNHGVWACVTDVRRVVGAGRRRRSRTSMRPRGVCLVEGIRSRQSYAFN